MSNDNFNSYLILTLYKKKSSTNQQGNFNFNDVYEKQDCKINNIFKSMF